MKRLLQAVVLLAMLTSGCTGLFFYPERQFRDNPVALQFSPQDVYFKTSDGLTLHGWYFQPPVTAQGTVLVFHGNAQNLSTHVNSVLWLVKEGFNLFIFDYRGYGKSEGSATISGIHRDAAAALETALSLSGEGGGIVVLGQSLGGAVATYTVAHTPYKARIKALILESAFAGYRLIAREKLAHFFPTWPFQYPLSYLVADSYSPIRWIRDVSPVPVLILHGTDDPVVPERHGRMLYEAALDPKEFLKTGVSGHVMSFADVSVRKFVAQYIKEHTEKP